MTIFFEISKPWKWRPGRYESDLIVRYWWGFFAIARLKVSFRDFCETPKQWQS